MQQTIAIIKRRKQQQITTTATISYGAIYSTRYVLHAVRKILSGDVQNIKTTTHTPKNCGNSQHLSRRIAGKHNRTQQLSLHPESIHE